MAAPKRPPEPVQARIVASAADANGIGWVELEGPHLAQDVQSGHFAMVARPGVAAPDALRPFAYFRAMGPHRARFLLRERPGAPGSLLRAPRGTAVTVRGPLGRPFVLAEGPVWAVAGGVGAAAFGPLLHQGPLAAGLRLFVGVRDHTEAGIVQALGACHPEAAQSVTVYSNDGSLGPQGSAVNALATALNEAPVRPAMVLACGPQGMLEAVAALALMHRLPCQVSVGVALPCGVGTCGGCRHQGVKGQSLLACVDGPTYFADRLYDPSTATNRA